MKKNGRELFGKGFTLIELMVVSAVMAVIAALAYPSYQESVRKTRRAEGRAALMQLLQQEERYYSQNTTYIAFGSTSSDADEAKFRWYSGESAKVSAYEISAAACEGETVQTCVLLTAKPGTQKVNQNHTDPACGNLMLSSTGEKKVSGSAIDCWQ
ncbi:type IV pilin protein [soil metagenome]